MSQSDQEFLERLLSTFMIEAAEHIDGISSGLVELEKADDETMPGVLERIYRGAHSLKGAARAVEISGLEKACHALESLFSALRSRPEARSQEIFDLAHAAVDAMKDAVDSGKAKTFALPKAQIDELVQKAEDVKFAREKPTEAAPKPTPTPPPALEPTPEPTPAPEPEPDALTKPARGKRTALSQTVRIATSKLDTLLLQAEELLTVKLAGNERVTRLRDIRDGITDVSRLWDEARRDAQQALPESERTAAGSAAAGLMRRMDLGHTALRSLQAQIGEVAMTADRDQRAFGAMLDQLLEDMKSILMLPFSTLLDVFPKMVRDIANEQGKKVDLAISGAEIEVDKRILEEMKDALVHLIRNSVDHGIETPEVREAAGKPAAGKLCIDIAQVDSAKVEITVSDNGKGMDADAIRQSAVTKGLIDADEANALDDDDALALIYRSGFSTSGTITDISGRGLGMAIVREKVEELGGDLSLETRQGHGTVFRIRLPITLATFRGILVEATQHLFVLPTVAVDRVTRVARDEVKTVENRVTIPLGGATLPFVSLAEVLEMPVDDAGDNGYVTALVLGRNEQRIAFRVDDIHGEREVLVKGLGAQLARVRNVAGATVLGSGQVVPILNPTDLLQSARNAGGAAVRRASAKAEEQVKSILVVEDSITSRMLVQSILQAAGYHVETAVDGAAGLATLKTGDFDLVVSDVDMPRMNGFQLTESIRADAKLGDTPVVLCTSLASREDREHGIDVGANAYIVKSSFDQSDLLDVIQRLV